MGHINAATLHQILPNTFGCTIADIIKVELKASANNICELNGFIYTNRIINEIRYEYIYHECGHGHNKRLFGF